MNMNLYSLILDPTFELYSILEPRLDLNQFHVIWIYPDYINWVLMILSTLDTRCRDDLDFILIEIVIIFSYDLDHDLS